MQQGTEKGLPIFPYGKQTWDKRCGQRGEDQRSRPVAVRGRRDDYRDGQQQGQNLSTKKQEGKRQNSRRRSHSLGGIFCQTAPNLRRIVIHAASGKIGQVGNIGAQTVTAKELRQ